MRGFFGGKKGGGGGAGGRFGFSGASGSTSKTKEMMKEKLLLGKKASSNQGDYASMIRERLEAKKSELLRASAESKSASFKAAVEQMIVKAEKKARKEIEKKKHIEIKPRQFTGGSGGRIDSRGNIYDAQGKVVMTVDKKTGAIKSPGGMNLGKYDPGAAGFDHKISTLIARYTKGQDAGSIWGRSGPAQPGGGSIWGPNSDDDKGGGWW